MLTIEFTVIPPCLVPVVRSPDPSSPTTSPYPMRHRTGNGLVRDREVANQDLLSHEP